MAKTRQRDVGRRQRGTSGGRVASWCIRFPEGDLLFVVALSCGLA
jgi:hypothetical protein